MHLRSSNQRSSTQATTTTLPESNMADIATGSTESPTMKVQSSTDQIKMRDSTTPIGTQSTGTSDDTFKGSHSEHRTPPYNELSKHVSVKQDPLDNTNSTLLGEIKK